MTEGEIIDLLARDTRDFSIAVARKMAFLATDTDADYVTVSPSGLTTQYEIKVSTADFRKDASKPSIRRYANPLEPNKPNYFYYVTAPGIVQASDIPEWAGWMQADPESPDIHVAKIAPRIRKEALPLKQILRLAKAMRQRGDGKRKRQTT
jgi:hypothetical protein